MTDPMDSTLTGEEERAIAEINGIVAGLTGVQLNERHFAMVASRLRRRLTELGLGSIPEYLTYLRSHSISENPKLVGLLTTHHTYFFREFSHFDHIKNNIFPSFVTELKKRADKKLKIWAVACSRGQEVYSLAMYLDLHLRKAHPDLSFSILGTDVDPTSIEIARNGVYLRSDLKEAPLSLTANHWVKGTGDIDAYVKARQSLRGYCEFEVGNLLELREGSHPKGPFDIIFCRNVFIYFNNEQIKQFTEQLLHRLTASGHLFIGTSESLVGLKLPIENAGPSIYRRKTTEAPSRTTRVERPAEATPPAPAPRPIRVLCVDDSPSILTLLKRILSADHGFEVVGTAANGLEAEQQVKALNPDLVTLDIHMPEQTGIEYLEKNYRAGHPPVVMVTSVSRENADLAGTALRLGATDYVEKPALSQLERSSEEIRNKLNCAYLDSKAKTPQRDLTLDKSFERKVKILNPDRKLLIAHLPLSARSKIKNLIRELRSYSPPAIFLLVEGAKDALPKIAELLTSEIGVPILYSQSLPDTPRPSEIYLLDFLSVIKPLIDKTSNHFQVELLIYGDVSASTAKEYSHFRKARIILEDLGSAKGSKGLMPQAFEVVPTTSFAYLTLEYFSQDLNEKNGGKT